MAKKPFTTRLDENVLALAQKLARIDRRSATSVLEIAMFEYAKARGISLDNIDEDKSNGSEV